MPYNLCGTCGHLPTYHDWNDSTAEWDCDGGHDCDCAFYIAVDWKKL